MFAIRFVQQNKDYKSYSVASYEVKRTLDGSAEVELSRKLSGGDETTEYVGDDEKFSVAYITNDVGKTIDVIRQKNEQTD